MADVIRGFWEYKVQGIELGGADSGTTDLNRIGDEGWEFVQALGEPTTGRQKVLCIFKRPRGKTA